MDNDGEELYILFQLNDKRKMKIGKIKNNFMNKFLVFHVSFFSNFHTTTFSTITTTKKLISQLSLIRKENK